MIWWDCARSGAGKSNYFSSEFSHDGIGGWEDLGAQENLVKKKN